MDRKELIVKQYLIFKNELLVIENLLDGKSIFTIKSTIQDNEATGEVKRLHYSWLQIKSNDCKSYFEKIEVIDSFNFKMYFSNSISDKAFIRYLKSYKRDIKKELDNIAKYLSKNNIYVESINKDNRGYIYIMEMCNYYKIGRCNKNKTRLGEYTRLPEKPIYHVIEWVDDCKQLEKELHSKFSSKRVNGECFTLSLNDINEAKEKIKNHVVNES